MDLIAYYVIIMIKDPWPKIRYVIIFFFSIKKLTNKIIEHKGQLNYFIIINKELLFQQLEKDEICK